MFRLLAQIVTNNNAIAGGPLESLQNTIQVDRPRLRPCFNSRDGFMQRFRFFPEEVTRLLQAFDLPDTLVTCHRVSIPMREALKGHIIKDYLQLVFTCDTKRMTMKREAIGPIKDSRAIWANLAFLQSNGISIT